MDSMIDGFKEADLAAWIEGDLPPRRAARLEKRLEGAPDLRRHLEQLRADRDALRALPEPVLPRDFIDGMDDQLARPMLMEYRPGEFRRRHRPSVWPRVAARVAVAAALLGAIGGGVWFGMTQGGGTPSGAPELVADQDGPSATDRLVDVPAPAPWPSDAVAIHHAEPIPFVADAPVPARGTSARPPLVRLASFTLVLDAASIDDAEGALFGALDLALAPAPDPDAFALVRNYSDDEARTYLAGIVADRSRHADPHMPQLTALLDASRSGMDERALRAWRSTVARTIGELTRAESGAAPPRPSGTLAGAEQWAAGIPAQLRFSAEGATHAVSIPVEYFSALLESLHQDGRTAPRFQLEGATADAPSSLHDQLRDLVAVRAAVQELAAGDDPVVIQIPVVIDVPND